VEECLWEGKETLEWLPQKQIPEAVTLNEYNEKDLYAPLSFCKHDPSI
jgi:hypothetical protein